MQINDQIKLPQCLDMFCVREYTFPLGQGQGPGQIAVLIKNPCKFFFYRIIYFRTGILLFQKPHTGGGEYDVPQRRETNDKYFQKNNFLERGVKPFGTGVRRMYCHLSDPYDYMIRWF